MSTNNHYLFAAIDQQVYRLASCANATILVYRVKKTRMGGCHFR